MREQRYGGKIDHGMHLPHRELRPSRHSPKAGGRGGARKKKQAGNCQAGCGSHHEVSGKPSKDSALGGSEVIVIGPQWKEPDR